MARPFSPPPCPKCQANLGWSDVRRNFVCPGCGTKLQSAAPGAMFAMVVIMTIPVFFASNPIALFVSVAVCGAVTIYVIASCTRIQTEEADAAT